MTASEGFPPVAGPGARVLVLGSLPGRRSLRDGEYYAHPRNAFWRLVDDLLRIPRTLPYVERTAKLAGSGVALWDVLHSSVRPGSLDARIDMATARANDFATFLQAHPGVELIAFNGRKAADLFARLVQPDLAAAPREVTLPSTSPAHAAMPYEEKRRHWSQLLRILER